MTWRILISAPYFLPVVEDYRQRLEAQGLELVIANVCERVLRQAPHLKVISKWGTGIDSIDTDAAARLGIRICNTPNAFTDCVADSTLGYVLNFARRLSWMDQDIRKGKWTKPDAVTLRECT